MAITIGTEWTKLVEYASTSTYTITYRLYAKYSASSVANNTHTIQLKWTTQKTSGGTGVWASNTTTPTVSGIAGGNPTSWTGSGFNIPKGSAVTETDRTTSGDIIITHNADGSYSDTWNWNLSYVYEGGSKSGTVDVILPTIPRASSMALSSGSISTIGSTTATITTASTAFTHNITTSYNGTSYTLASGVKATSGSTVSTSLSIPAGLRNAMRTNRAKNITLTLTLTTLSGSTSIGINTATLTITVPTATISVSSASVNCNANITWTLSNIDLEACVYTVQRSYEGTVRYTDITRSNASADMSKAVANLTFETYMTAVTSGTVVAKVTTYVGTSSSYTSVGSSSTSYTVKIPTGTYYWKTAKGSITYASDMVSGKSVAGYEGVTCTFTATKQNSSHSTVSSHSVTCSRADVVFTSSYSNGTVTITVTKLPASSSDYTFTFTCSVTDSRGTVSTATSNAITGTGYSIPTITGSVQRADTSGNADSEGTKALFSLKATSHSLTTIKSIVVKYGSTTVGSKTGQSTTPVSYSFDTHSQSTNYDVNSTYDFVVTVTDNLNKTNSITLHMGTAGVVLSLHPSGGIGMGKVATANRVDSAYPIFAVYATAHTSEIRSGDTTSTYSSYVGAHGLSGKIYLVASGTETGNKALTAVNNEGTTNDVLRVNQDNEVILPRATYYTSSLTANNGTQTPSIQFKPTNIHEESVVQRPGGIYYQTSVRGYEGRFMFREYSPTSADVTKYLNVYEYYSMPAPDKDLASSKNYEILTTKPNQGVVLPVSNGGTGQSSLTNVTVGNASNVTITNTQPTFATGYYINFGTATSGNLPLRANAGFLYRMKQGTTSAEGYNGIVLGRNIASGSADNGYGWLRLFGHGTNFYNIYPNETANTADYSLYIPNKNGTVALEPKALYENSTGTTSTVTLSETSANFTYLDIYYYSVPSASTSTIRYGYTRVYAPNGKTVTLANTVYWSNYLEITNRTIVISGTSITNASNEQAQFRFTNGSSPSRSSTSSLIYITRIDGIR